VHNLTKGRVSEQGLNREDEDEVKSANRSEATKCSLLEEMFGGWRLVQGNDNSESLPERLGTMEAKRQMLLSSKTTEVVANCGVDVSVEDSNRCGGVDAEQTDA